MLISFIICTVTPPFLNPFQNVAFESNPFSSSDDATEEEKESEMRIKTPVFQVNKSFLGLTKRASLSHFLLTVLKLLTVL